MSRESDLKTNGRSIECIIASFKDVYQLRDTFWLNNEEVRPSNTEQYYDVILAF